MYAMKWLAAPLLASSIPALSFADETADQAQVLKIERAIAFATSWPEIAPYYDNDIVLDDVTPGRVRGLKAVASDLSAQLANDKNIKAEILQIAVIADDRLAYAYSIQHATFTQAATNQPVDITFRQVDCYHRVNGKWLLTYQQFSVPFDPKTGRAVFNARP